jgi:hypothetical protein
VSGLRVYSQRFTAWAAETFPDSYVVPTGFVAIVRDVVASSGGGAMTNFVWGANGIVKMGGTQFTIEALNQFYHWEGRQVIEAGEFIYAQSDFPTDGAISGYLLSLP